MADAKGMRPIAISSGLHIPEHDYIIIEYNSNYDVIGYYLGGLSGTQVAEVTVTYTDTTKADISTVERSQ
jgi:hypothetical protein